MKKTYLFYKNLIAGRNLPCAVLDLDMFYENADAIIYKAGTKKIRIASKSIRCTKALQFLMERHEKFTGIMTYSGEETHFLADKGFDDFLLGYPIVNKAIIERLCIQIKSGKQICFMTDSLFHLKILEETGKKINCIIPVCIDYDLSDDYLFLHFGVRRSGIKNLQSLKLYLSELKKSEHIRLDGLMGYEAQVAGIGDTTFGKGIKSNLVQLLKKKAIENSARKRAEAVKFLRNEGYSLRFINGGGTGSIDSTCQEESVTEVTVGSGFFNGHLFDNYANFKFQPALFFALEIVRKPSDRVFTCFGGGYIGSGATGIEKMPKIYLPEGGFLDKNEGAGEVQTPVVYKKITEPLNIGDPIFFRHSKSGEICERFNEIITVSDGRDLQSIPTYRGEGYNFG